MLDPMSERTPTYGHQDPAEAFWHPVPSWPDPPAPFLPLAPGATAGLAVWPGDGRLTPATVRSPLAEVPLTYPELLRGPRRRWWKPFLSLLVLVAAWGVGFAAVVLSGDLVHALTSDQPFGDAFGQGVDLAGFEPLAMLVGDLVLAALIPAAVLATWAVHRVRPGFVSSVTGALRWRWLLRCVLTLLPLWVLYLAIGVLLEPPATGRPDGWVLLLVMAVVVTPFQAAGEEYLFRGWLVQNIAVWFARPVLGFVVSTVVSSALFALIHGSLDPWILLDLAVFAAVACYLNWRTGGLETGIALHLVNNVTLGIATITIGGYTDSFVDTTTTGRPVDLVVTVVVQSIAAALLLWQGRRSQVQRHVSPVAALPPLPAAAAPVYR